MGKEGREAQYSTDACKKRHLTLTHYTHGAPAKGEERAQTRPGVETAEMVLSGGM